MPIEIVEQSPALLGSYGDIPISFTVVRGIKSRPLTEDEAAGGLRWSE